MSPIMGLLPGRPPKSADRPVRYTEIRALPISARAQLVRQRTRAKNQVHATLVRNLKGKPPVTDLSGARGRRWLAEQTLPADEQETVAACLRQIAFLDGEIALIERALAEQVLASTEMRRLLTLPGVNFVTAAALMAAIGEIGRFPTARQLVSYLGLDPRVQQSGSEPARHGRISKQGPGETRHVLVEAAWHASRARLPQARPGLAAGDQERGCRTGARISSAVKRPSSAAGNSPTPCALARGHPRPPALSQRSRPPSSDLTSIRNGAGRCAARARDGGGQRSGSVEAVGADGSDPAFGV